jgi:predicted Zn-dependent protease
MLRSLVLVTVALGVSSAQIPAEKELALGKSLIAEIERESKPVDNPEVTGFVGGIVDKLAREVNLRFPVQLRVLESTRSIASTLPGGYLLLSSPAMLKAGSEAELAAVLAHQIAHIQLGHGAEGFRIKTGTVPLIFRGSWYGFCPRSGAALVPLAATSSLLESEAEADALGLRYLAKAGYDAEALIDVFDRWSDRWSGKYRPDGASRAEARELAKEQSAAVVDSSRFARIKLALAPAERRLPTLNAGEEAPPVLHRE